VSFLSIVPFYKISKEKRTKNEPESGNGGFPHVVDFSTSIDGIDGVQNVVCRDFGSSFFTPQGWVLRWLRNLRNNIKYIHFSPFLVEIRWILEGLKKDP